MPHAKVREDAASCSWQTMLQQSKAFTTLQKKKKKIVRCTSQMLLRPLALFLHHEYRCVLPPFKYDEPKFHDTAPRAK
jgi:hypothetical protein